MSEHAPEIDEFTRDRQAVDRMFPGPNYREVLATIGKALKPRTYFEIGVRRGDSFFIFSDAELAVGVDPAPAVTAEVPAHMHLETMTSETFFKEGHAARHFAERPIDLAFIDGLHVSEQILLDFVWVLPFMAEGGVVLLHDVLPLRAEVASRERQTQMWTGDSWRTALAIADAWPDLSYTVIPTKPSGLLAIRISKAALAAPRRPLMDSFKDMAGRAFDQAVRQQVADLGQIPNVEADILAAFRPG